MKKTILLLVFIAITNYSIAQEFPSPTNFNIEVCYNNYPHGGDFCGPQYPIFATVHFYSFDAPDTTGIESKLVGYNLYYNDSFMVSFSGTTYEAECYGAGDYYVTAVYTDPTGESFPSNVVYAEGFMISVSDYILSNIIEVYPNPVTDILYINNNSASNIESIQVYDVLGKLVLKSEGDLSQLDVSSLKGGVYLVKIETDLGVVTKKVVKE